MLANLFRSNQPAVLAALLVLVPVLFGAAFTRSVAEPALSMPLHQLLAHGVEGRGWLQGLVSSLFIAISSALLAVLVNNSELLDRRTHLPALFLPLLIAAFGPAAPLDPSLTGLPFVILAMQRAWTMSNTGRVMGTLFDAGLLIGIASLFYLPYAFLVVVLWASVSVIRPFQWREYVVPLLATAVVFYLAWGVVTLTGLGYWQPLLTIVPAHVNDPSIAPVQSSQRILLFMVLGGLVPVGMYSFARSYQRGIMRLKNIRSSFLALTSAMLLLMLFVYLLTGVVPPVLPAAPLTVFCAHGLQGTKRAWLGEFGVFSLLILALWAQWGW
jgi:hypothetical protein